MAEVRRNFTENIHRKKLKELKDYVLSIKDVKDQFYDPKIHTDWEETKLLISEDKPIKWCVVRVYRDEDNFSIYSFSDENGNVALPKSEAGGLNAEIVYTIGETSLNEIYKEVEKQQPQKSGWKYEIVGLILILLFAYVRFILPGQIRQYKLQKEQELINNVVQKPYTEYEKYISQIVKKVRALEKENPFIYVYTNDTEPLDFRILPNVQVYQNIDNYSLGFVTKQMQADDLKSFIDNEDTKGYFIWLNTNRIHISIRKLNKNKTADLNVTMTYFYSEKIKEQLKKQVEKRKKYQFINGKTEDLDSIQTARVIIPSEIEKKSKNLEGILMRFDEKIIQSAIKQKNSTQKIYFSFYAKNGSKEELESEIKKFEKLFYDGKKSKDCKIRKVYLKKKQ